MRVWIPLCCAVIAAVVFAGCLPPVSDESGGAPAKVIGAAMLTQSHVFYQDLVEAMTAEGAKHGYDIRFQYCEMDGARQNQQVETFVLQGVDAIVLAPYDSSAVGPMVADARAAGIPVFTADIRADDADVVCHIASDNVDGGRKIGAYLAELLSGQGKVGIVDHPEVASVIDRTTGFEEALSAYPGISIVSRVPGGGVRDKAMKAAQDMLQAHPDINAIFAINDDSALGALAAVEERGLEDSIAIVGFDGTPEAREMIRRGSALKADAVQFPDEIGRITVDAIAKHFAGETLPKEIPVAVEVIDKAALDEEGAP